MTDYSGWITVFRASDPDSEVEAQRVIERLSEEGVEAVLVDDAAPGVVTGTREIRVAPENRLRAEVLVAIQESEDTQGSEPGDPSHQRPCAGEDPEGPKCRRVRTPARPGLAP